MRGTRRYPSYIPGGGDFREEVCMYLFVFNIYVWNEGGRAAQRQRTERKSVCVCVCLWFFIKIKASFFKAF